jgi:hypothetical protein
LGEGAVSGLRRAGKARINSAARRTDDDQFIQLAQPPGERYLDQIDPPNKRRIRRRAKRI